MIFKGLEVFTEYISIILFVHKIESKQIKLNLHCLFDFLCYLILVFIAEHISFGKVLLYVYWFMYTRIRISASWKQAIKPFAAMMCIIPIFQLLIYALISVELLKVFDVYLVGIIVNVLIIAFLLLWKKKYLFSLMNVVTRFRKFIFLILLIVLFIYLISYFLEYKVVKSYLIDQLAICFLIISLMFILWINSENEKMHKAEELRTYQMYASTFEEAIAAIRMRQHEFDNHISAIRSMQYTIHDTEKLIAEQNKYCDKILNDNKFNKLLRLKTSPILIGYLYSKFTAASAENIQITYEIADISIDNVEISDFIEIIGILFDNAVEALATQTEKKMEIRLLDENGRMMLSMSNVSPRKTNSEIEQLFTYGYSTKGAGRGVGLYRLNSLIKKYDADMHVENAEKYDLNYLRFKILF